MKTNKEQSRVNTYFQDVTIKNACELLAIEKRLQLDGLVLPNNIIVNRDGISCAEFIQWYEKSRLPKTYKECCEVIEYKITGDTIIGYNCGVLRGFQQLLICRDAYWKIAGEEMGLGKPWKPDFMQNYGSKYSMLFANCVSITGSRILVFPTEEMQDAFYENFKDLIEQCKELL